MSLEDSDYEMINKTHDCYLDADAATTKESNIENENEKQVEASSNESTVSVQDKTEKMLKVGASSAVAVGAIPVVTVVAVQAVGFGSAGIASGSVAAGMMSSAAIANGGGVAAGSLVATGQSIGAIGFGAALPITGIVSMAIGGVTLLGLEIYKAGHSFIDSPPLRDLQSKGTVQLN